MLSVSLSQLLTLGSLAPWLLGSLAPWLLGAAGVLVAWLLNAVAAPAVKRHREAVAAYRLAFDNVLLNLRENPDYPLAQIAFGCHPRHLTAIDKFRHSVPIWRRRCFEADAAYYKQAYDIARDYGSVFAVALSEHTEVARTKRKHYSEAIQHLLSYA